MTAGQDDNNGVLSIDEIQEMFYTHHGDRRHTITAGSIAGAITM